MCVFFQGMGLNLLCFLNQIESSVEAPSTDSWKTNIVVLRESCNGCRIMLPDDETMSIDLSSMFGDAYFTGVLGVVKILRKSSCEVLAH